MCRRASRAVISVLDAWVMGGCSAGRGFMTHFFRSMSLDHGQGNGWCHLRIAVHEHSPAMNSLSILVPVLILLAGPPALAQPRVHLPAAGQLMVMKADGTPTLCEDLKDLTDTRTSHKGSKLLAWARQWVETRFWGHFPLIRS